VSTTPSAIEVASNARSDDSRTRLIAARLRQNTTRRATLLDSRLPSFALEHAISGDLGHLHAAHDLRTVPVPASHRRLIGPLIFRARRALRRGLQPLPEAQSVWNGANARVVTFLLRQLAAQARTVESLERQLSELQDELHRR
jgi:hypothetical protein